MLPRGGGADGPVELLEMVSFGMDPQWCGQLFAVCGPHDKAVLALPDAFAISAAAAPPIDVGWIAVAGTFGLQVCRLSCSLDSVKATGVIFLLGVGSLMFYKLYHLCCTRRPPRRPPHSPSLSAAATTYFPFSLPLAHVEDSETLKGLYFGPRSPACGEDVPFRRKHCSSIQDGSSSPSSSSCGGTSCEDEDGQDADISEGSCAGEHQGALRRGVAPDTRNTWSPPVRQRMHPLHKAHSRPLGHALNPCCPRGWKRPRHFSMPVSAVSHKSGATWSVANVRSVALPSFIEQGGQRSLPATPGRGLHQEVVGRQDLAQSSVSHPWRNLPVGLETPCHRNKSRLLQANPCSISEEPSEGPTNSKVFWEESFDSLGFPNNVSGDSGRNIPREGSFDSTCSDLSLDFSLRESVDTSTMACMDKLQKEIDQLKTNCLIMDEEFETIKCNRNLPGMSNLMKGNIVSDVNGSSVEVMKCANEETDSVKQQKARACFAGLYSLTTIKNSTSSEMSDSFPPPGGRNSVGSAESLEWDSPLAKSPLREIQESTPLRADIEGVPRPHISLESPQVDSFSSHVALGEDESAMVSLEWDMEDLVEYPEAPLDECVGGEQMQSPIALNMDLSYGKELGHSVLSDLQATVSSEADKSEATPQGVGCAPNNRLHQVEACMSEERQMVDSLMSASFVSSHLPSLTHSKVSNLEALPLHWSSEESGYMDWDGRAEENRSSQWVSPMEQQSSERLWEGGSCAVGSSGDTSELSTPGTENFHSDAFSSSELPIKNIGERVKVYEYALQEWQGGTHKAQTILKGYAEIPSILDVGYIRRIRGDNYCAVRATIFQTLSQSIAVPSGQEAYQKLSCAHEGQCHWLQDWKFPEELPYSRNNVLHGMKVCLEKLDYVASYLAHSNDKETTLASLLNSDASLDLLIVEAVKLHMLLCAIELHGQSTSGAQVPLFAVLLFARETSETPKDFMNNHLKEVGHTGGLEQVEMFLLGYTLGVTLQVVRPSMFGTNEFICCYPDWNVGSWPQVSLIAEDDRHYNVLVK
ncbi:uncharacterized protein LOC124170851 isoform X2 [Ischnura elegans]|uniref:uncharacterized protein LOC124170851 isoform X2 n=1 Tax=Ischnura elegans TaxID=197161 RepID=UPI001ED8A46E|nr:uncharacterized protein LOC124170851 isoform X2 [Ischnura elegans]